MKSKNAVRIFALAVTVVSAAFLHACTGSQEARTPGIPNAATLKAGEALFFQCLACHTTGQNEFHSLGPNLWGIFGSKAGAKPGFMYSDALKNSNMIWTDVTMDKWLEKPSTFIAHNIMAYAGMPKEQDRATLIAYLKSITSE